MDIDLTTEYLGLKLASPLIASASPCTGQPDVLQRLEDNGAGAAVLPSLFEEQIVREDIASHHLGDKYPAAEMGSLSDFPYLKDYNRGAEYYVRLVEESRRAVSMPIIASLNGSTPSGWVEHAHRMADAGADAIELNIYFVPTDVTVSGQLVEAQYLDVVSAIRNEIEIPLAVKIGPYFSSLPYFARQVVEAGANGLVLFNRYLEPEINLENHTVEPHLELSHPGELRLPLRWLAILRGQLEGCYLAATSGVHSGRDALKAIAAGADVVMVTSALMKQGAEHLQTIYDEMLKWLAEHEYGSVKQLVGSISHKACKTPSAFERANYASTIAAYMEQGASPQ